MDLKQETPLVSIGIPAYKSFYLKDCINSALMQTYKNIEVIVVNDKSPDDLDSIVQSFDDNRIKYFVNEINIGKSNLVANWNKCLSYAKGEFFCLLCDDDVYAPTFVEDMLALASEYPETNVFRSRVEIIDENNTTFDYYPASPSWQNVDDYMWHVFKDYTCQTVTEFFLRTKHILNCNGYVSLPLGWYSDFLSTYIFSNEGGIATTNKLLVKFRMSGKNFTSQKKENSEKKLLAAKLYKEKVSELITENNYKNQNNLIELLNMKTAAQNNYVLINSNFFLILKLFFRKEQYELSNKILIKSLIKKFFMI